MNKSNRITSSLAVCEHEGRPDMSLWYGSSLEGENQLADFLFIINESLLAAMLRLQRAAGPPTEG